MSYLGDLFGFGSADDQRDATTYALQWAFVIGLLAAIALIPFPLNLLAVVIVAFWILGQTRHKSDTADTVWNIVTFDKYR